MRIRKPQKRPEARNGEAPVCDPTGDIGIDGPGTGRWPIEKFDVLDTPEARRQKKLDDDAAATLAAPLESDAM